MAIKLYKNSIKTTHFVFLPKKIWSVQKKAVPLHDFSHEIY